MTTTRLSIWFRSQVRQNSSQLLQQTRQLNLFNLLGFSRQKQLEIFSKTGRAVILNTTSLENDEDGPTLNVDLTIEEDFSIKYDRNKDIIIRNYSSSLTEPAIISAHKNEFNDTDQSVLGQTFAGIIESIPHKLKNDKSFKYEVGDRVWGISPNTLGGTWSDYVPVPYKSIACAPFNIPLHFCGLYPLQLYGLHHLLTFAKLRMDSIQNNSVLFIGTGRRSLINVFAPLLKHLSDTNTITVIDNANQCRLDETVMYKQLNIDRYIELDENKDMDSIELDSHFDIVFDSIAMDRSEIMQHCKYVTKNGVYFWRQNHMSQFYDNIGLSKWRLALKGATFLKDIHRDLKKLNGIKFVPNIDMRATNETDISATLDLFAKYLTQMSFPIVIDKMYNLNDIRDAFNYAYSNDDSVLGDIGIMIEKESDNECGMFFEENVRPKTVKLPSIESLSNQKRKTKQSKLFDSQEIDIIIEDDSEKLKSSDYLNFVQDKTEIQTHTIAKNTSKSQL